MNELNINKKKKIFGDILRGDKIIWGLFLFLSLASLIIIFTSTSTIAYKRDNYMGEVFKHFGYLMFGFLLIVFIQRVNAKYVREAVLILTVVTVALLFFTTVTGDAVNGASRWNKIMGVSFQPSEMGKLFLICFLSYTFTGMTKENKDVLFNRALWVSAIIIVLIVFDNFSTAVLLSLVTFFMMLIAEVPYKKLFKLIGVLTLCGGLFACSLIFLPDSVLGKAGRMATWKARFMRFGEKKERLDAATYKITDTNRQVTHANIAIANGGIVGLPGNGQQRDYLPQAYSDFVFAIILEETGIIGGLLIMCPYFMLLFRCGRLAKKSKKKEYKFLMMGCALLISLQALTNMAVAVGAIPVTGQPLPLLSRGGTSLIITCVYFGIILSCSSKLNQEVKSKSSMVEGDLPPDYGIAPND